MSNISFSKGKFGIHKIGKLRFGVGVLAGLLMAISLSLFFVYLGESLRFLTYFQLTPEIRPANTFTDSYLVCALATSLGLSSTMYIWLGSPAITLWREKQLREAALLNIGFIFWTVLWLGSKIATVMYLMPQEAGLEIRQSGSSIGQYILFLLPFFIFLYNWQQIHRLYRAYLWIFYSFLICILVSLLISISLPINYKILNQYLIEVRSN